jgi:hypothetical protein
MNKVWLNGLLMSFFVMFAGINAAQDEQQREQLTANEREALTKKMHFALLNAVIKKNGLLAVSREESPETYEFVAFVCEDQENHWLLPPSSVRTILKHYEQRMQIKKEQEDEFGRLLIEEGVCTADNYVGGLFSVPPKSYVDARRKGLFKGRGDLVSFTVKIPEDVDPESIVVDPDAKEMGCDLLDAAILYYRFIHNLDGEDTPELLRNRARLKAAIESANAQAIARASARPLYWSELAFKPGANDYMIVHISLLRAATQKDGLFALPAGHQTPGFFADPVCLRGLDTISRTYHSHDVCDWLKDHEKFIEALKNDDSKKWVFEKGGNTYDGTTENFDINSSECLSAALLASQINYYRFIHNLDDENNEEVLKNRAELKAAIESKNGEAIVEASQKPLHSCDRDELGLRSAISILQACMTTGGLKSPADLLAVIANDPNAPKELGGVSVNHNIDEKEDSIMVRKFNYLDPYVTKYEPAFSAERISGTVGLAYLLLKMRVKDPAEHPLSDSEKEIAHQLEENVLNNRDVYPNNIFLDTVRNYHDFLLKKDGLDPRIVQNRENLLDAIVSLNAQAIIAASAQPLHEQDLEQ